MFTNIEIEEYSNLLNILKQPNEQNLPPGYNLIAFGGGKDGVPHFKLLINQDIQTYVIWVRGTDFTDINDIKINKQAKLISFYQGECHSGYFIGAYNIIYLILKYLNDEHINKIVCLGHSLGGAVSSIIATILKKGDFGPVQNIGNIQQKFHNRIRALTFGTPPTFSESISEETNEFITNIVFKGDVVPKLGILFEALSIFQRRKVTIQMYENNCLNTTLHI